MKKDKLEKISNGSQLIIGIISITVINPNEGDYTYQIKLNENDKVVEEKKNPAPFKKALTSPEAYKFNQIIKNKTEFLIDFVVSNESKEIGSISIPMIDVLDERVNSENVIKEETIMKGEEKVAVIKMRLALRKNRFFKSVISDEQMLDKIQNSAAERLETVKNIETRESIDVPSFPTKLNPPRKSLYQIEIDAIDQKLQTVQPGTDIYKKMAKEKKLQEKKEKKRIEKNEKVLKLYNLPKEESLLTRFFAGHITNKTTWMSRVGNFYLTQNYLCFKQQLVSFMLTIPLFSIKKCVIKARTINFEFNGNEFVIFERGLSKRMIKVIEEQLNSYNQSENRPVVEHKTSIVDLPTKEEIYLQDKSNGNGTIEINDDKEDISTTDSDDFEFDSMLSKEPTHVAFIPDDILETVVENREFNVTAVKFFYILFSDQSTFFQDFLVYKGGSSEMVTSKWGNRENEIGSWRQLDYIAPVPPLPLCPTTTRTNRTQYFHLTKDKLIFEERLSMFDVYFGEKFQVGNRIVAITNGKKCNVTVKTGVIFLSKVWGFKSTIVNNSRKSGGGEMRNLLDNAQVSIDEYLNKKGDVKKDKERRKTVTLNEPLPNNNNNNSSQQKLDSISSKTPRDDLDQLEKKVNLISKELELTKTKLAELKKATDPLYQRIFSLVLFVVLLYLLFKKNI